MKLDYVRYLLMGLLGAAIPGSFFDLRSWLIIIIASLSNLAWTKRDWNEPW